MKLRRPRFVDRLRSGLGSGAATFVAFATVAGFLFGAKIIPAKTYWALVAMIALVGTAVSVAYFRGRLLALPMWVCDELSGEPKYTCKPCSAQNLREANKEVQPIFGRDHIDNNILEHWRLKNPKGFMEITNDQNVLVGCFVVVGLEPSFMEQLKKGNVSESLITGDVVLPMSQTKKLNDIYISGVMVKDPGGYLGSKRTRVLIWCMLKYLRHHLGISNTKELYAVAITEESERLLKSLNFSLWSSGSSRVDRHNLYRIDCSKEQWDSISSRIGDLSAMCTISY